MAAIRISNGINNADTGIGAMIMGGAAWMNTHEMSLGLAARSKTVAGILRSAGKSTLPPPTNLTTLTE